MSNQPPPLNSSSRGRGSRASTGGASVASSQGSSSVGASAAATAAGIETSWAFLPSGAATPNYPTPNLGAGSRSSGYLRSVLSRGRGGSFTPVAGSGTPLTSTPNVFPALDSHSTSAAERRSSTPVGRGGGSAGGNLGMRSWGSSRSMVSSLSLEATSGHSLAAAASSSNSFPHLGSLGGPGESSGAGNNAGAAEIVAPPLSSTLLGTKIQAALTKSAAAAPSRNPPLLARISSTDSTNTATSTSSSRASIRSKRRARAEQESSSSSSTLLQQQPQVEEAVISKLCGKYSLAVPVADDIKLSAALERGPPYNEPIVIRTRFRPLLKPTAMDKLKHSLRPAAKAMLETPNAGGESENSEALSLEILASLRGFRLFAGEMQVSYSLHAPLVDYLAAGKLCPAPTTGPAAGKGSGGLSKRNSSESGCDNNASNALASSSNADGKGEKPQLQIRNPSASLPSPLDAEVDAAAALPSHDKGGAAALPTPYAAPSSSSSSVEDSTLALYSREFLQAEDLLTAELSYDAALALIAADSFDSVGGTLKAMQRQGQAKGKGEVEEEQEAPSAAEMVVTGVGVLPHPSMLADVQRRIIERRSPSEGVAFAPIARDEGIIAVSVTRAMKFVKESNSNSSGSTGGADPLSPSPWLVDPETPLIMSPAVVERNAQGFTHDDAFRLLFKKLSRLLLSRVGVHPSLGWQRGVLHIFAEHPRIAQVLTETLTGRTTGNDPTVPVPSRVIPQYLWRSSIVLITVAPPETMHGILFKNTSKFSTFSDLEYDPKRHDSEVARLRREELEGYFQQPSTTSSRSHQDFFRRGSVSRAKKGGR